MTRATASGSTLRMRGAAHLPNPQDASACRLGGIRILEANREITGQKKGVTSLSIEVTGDRVSQESTFGGLRPNQVAPECVPPRFEAVLLNWNRYTP